jgi:hypothetical protein
MTALHCTAGLPHFMASLLYSSDPDLEEKALDAVIHITHSHPESRHAFLRAGAGKLWLLIAGARGGM